jgi:glycosyltransferase involved in cell wall biosynthesis
MNQDVPNILLITARADFGGGPEHLYRLLKMLNREVNFFIACPKDYPYWDRYIEVIGENRLIEIPHRKFSIPVLRNIIAFAREKKIDIIHSHGKGAGIYSRLLSAFTGIKCIHTFHGIHTGEYSALKKFFYLTIERFLSAFTRKFISVSDSEAGRVMHSGITGRDKLVIIPNGTTIPDEISAFNYDQEIYRLITITRFDYAKNSLLLIPIAKEILDNNIDKKFRFAVLGKGEEEEEFRKRLKEEKIEEYFDLEGFVPDTGEYLKNSFCYISTSRWEGLPLGVLEAMSYGVPVIGSDVTGNKDLIQHDVNGYLYDITNPGKAADFILALAGNKEKHKLFAVNGRNIAEKDYSLNSMAEKTLKIYQGLR